MMRLSQFTMLGQPIVITDRVKPTALFRFQGYILVNVDRWPELLEWIDSRGGSAYPRAMFDERNFPQ
jgi:hypothetical protein